MTMSNRSYFTTPMFVIVALISIYVFVVAQNTQAFIFVQADNTAHSTLNRSLEQYQLIRKQQEKVPAIKHILPPDEVRAIYISGWVAGSPSMMSNLISFIENSKINAVIIDIKDSTGVISFLAKDNAFLDSFGTDSTRISDIDALIEKLHSKNIYVIGRLTTFQDPLLAKTNPSFAFKRTDDGSIWKDRKGLSFINPNNKEAWNYIATLAEYSYQKGFDEINFDYIRYPSDGDIKHIDYEIPSGFTRRHYMKKFYEYIDVRLREGKKIPISADIFGLVTSASDDIGIGQYFEDIIPHFDFVAAMVYPSHYSSGFFGYSNPNEHPYGVVHAAMKSAKERAIAMDQDPQKLRTWIQDFSLGVHYGKKEITDQIKATYDVGLDSYMVWDPKNRYTQEAYK